MTAPIAALLVTVVIATGEVRYRIPFDVFFIAIACAVLHRRSRARRRRPLQPLPRGARECGCLKKH